MILSSILYPVKEICNEKEMYFRGWGFRKEVDGSIIFKKGGKLETSTYFNSFSLDKWFENTIIDNVDVEITLKGNFIVTLWIVFYENGKCFTKEQERIDFSSTQRKKINMSFRDKIGIGYFTLEALSDDSFFYGASYNTQLNDNPRDIRIAIGICTYKREEYVIKNLYRIEKTIEDKGSILYGHIDVFVSDNGNSLNYNTDSNHIKVYPNKNYGGAGGFTRCLIEAMNNDMAQYTHFIFMDDDVVLDVHAIEKNYVFLSLLKEEKERSIIGGAMFSTDERFLQFESASQWCDIGFKFNRRNVDLRLIDNIVLNEKKYDVNYNAWCYCCIPFDIVNRSNLPLPIFFHMDDIEYCLRNALPIITLNGINVWHLYKKGLISAKNDYYDTRNKLIMLSEIDPNSAVKLAWQYYDSFTTEVLKYHYARALNAFQGIIDFAKGVDWLKHTNTLEIHQRLFNNVSWHDSPKEYEDKAHYSQPDIRNRKKKISLLFDEFLPTFKKSFILNNNGMEDTRGKRKVIVVNKKEHKCIVYKRNLRLALKCFMKRREVQKILSTTLENAIKDYNERITELQTLNFWNSYLGLGTEKKRKVLFVSSDNDLTSGAFRSMAVLCRLLQDRHNLEVSVLLPRKGDGTRLLRELAISYTIIPSEDWVVKLSDDEGAIKRKKELMLQNEEAEKKILHYIDEEKFDLVHINTTYHYVAAKAALKLNIPVVWHLREFLEEDQKRTIVDKKYGYDLIKMATKVIAISDSIYKKYQDIFADKLIRIYNGISSKDFYRENHFILGDPTPRFICAGAITPYKGQADLVEACGLLKQQYGLHFELLLVGNNTGPYVRSIQNLINHYQLNSEVKILGRRSDVNELFAESDIAFVCSQAEAFGRVTVEAMMSGCLVIGADNAGTSEIINNGKDGLLYEVNNPVDLCNKIVYALENVEVSREMAKSGNKKSISLYTADKNADNVFSVYESIWSEK